MKHGFSLVELSIVLVILGLLTGGILAGQSLIRAAELRSVTTQLEQYRAAVKNFSDKYKELPGDLTNATDIWGAANAAPATCRTTASTTQLTCNGNGDGQVIDNGLTSNESYRFWQHLANAGFIDGKFNGITMGTQAWSSTTDNSPSGKISSTLWFAWNWGTLTGSGGLYDGAYNNVLVFGGRLANNYPATAILKSEEIWNIDRKIDDAKPASGILVTGMPGGACTTDNTTSALNAEYLLDDSRVACFPVFRNLY